MFWIGSMFCHILSASQSWLTLLVIGVVWVLFFVGQNFKMAETCKQPSRKLRRSCRSDNLKTTNKIHIKSGRWFQIFLDFHPCLRKIPILTNIFQLGWNHQLETFQKVIFVTSAAALVSDLFQISVLELMLKWGFPTMVVPNNHGFFLLKMIILGCFGGTTIFGNTQMSTHWHHVGGKRLLLWWRGCHFAAASLSTHRSHKVFHVDVEICRIMGFETTVTTTRTTTAKATAAATATTATTATTTTTTTATTTATTTKSKNT